MTSNNQAPQNAIFIRKDSIIPKVTDYIDHALKQFPEVQLRCAGTAVQKAILVAEKCVSQGIAQYSRFTTQMIPIEGKQIIYTIIKMTRAKKTVKAPIKEQNQVQKPKYVAKKSQNIQSQDQVRKDQRKQSQNYVQSERSKKQIYNEDHRKRNERRQQQNYRENRNYEQKSYNERSNNNTRGQQPQKSNQRNVNNEPNDNRKGQNDRQYR